MEGLPVFRLQRLKNISIHSTCFSYKTHSSTFLANSAKNISHDSLIQIKPCVLQLFCDVYLFVGIQICRGHRLRPYDMVIKVIGQGHMIW